MKAIAVDVGGTFTDLIHLDQRTGKIGIHKVPTTTGDPSQGVISGLGDCLAREGIAPGDVAQVYHGTTTATNAVVVP